MLDNIEQFLNMKTYKTKQVLNIIGNVTQNQLVHWAEKGIVPPSHKDADGHGSYRLYIFQDLLKIALVSRFLHFGMSLRTIRQHLNWMENRPDPDMTSDRSGILGADGKGYKNLWEGLRKNPDAFKYYYEIREANSGMISYGFSEEIDLQEGITFPVEYALFINIHDLLSALEKATGEKL